MVKKPRQLPSDSKVPSSKKSTGTDDTKWCDIYHQQAKLRKEKEEVGFVKLPCINLYLNVDDHEYCQRIFTQDYFQ